MFKIDYWATEYDREQGESDNFMSGIEDETEAIRLATRLYNREGYACVEVYEEPIEEDDDFYDPVLHLSED